jgi:hypothetical protein
LRLFFGGSGTHNKKKGREKKGEKRRKEREKERKKEREKDRLPKTCTLKEHNTQQQNT